MTRPVWLRTSYYVLASDVQLGDITPWGSVVAVTPARGAMDWTTVTVRASDGTEDVQRLGRASRLPLIAMYDPIDRGAPSWCCPSACR